MIQDYGFRIYNPSIGRFLSVDPLAPDYPSWTPYAFAMNCPIAGVDLDGLEFYYAADGTFLYSNGQSTDVYVVTFRDVKSHNATRFTFSYSNISSVDKLMNNAGEAMTHDQFQKRVFYQYGETSQSISPVVDGYAWSMQNKVIQKGKGESVLYSSRSHYKMKTGYESPEKEKIKKGYNDRYMEFKAFEESGYDYSNFKGAETVRKISAAQFKAILGTSVGPIGDTYNWKGGWGDVEAAQKKQNTLHGAVNVFAVYKGSGDPLKNIGKNYSDWSVNIFGSSTNPVN